MTPVKKLRELRERTAAVPQPAPEPHAVPDRLAQLEQALAASERREHKLRAAQAKLHQALARQKSLNKSLVRSTSWRLTAPLRAAADACRTLGDGLRKAVRRRVASSPQAAAFHRDGVIAPVPLLTPAQCELILKHYWLDPRRNQRQGRKALGATDRLFNDIATRPALLALLKSILGDDIILWGTRVINQDPGGVHDWHTDIESAAPHGRFVSVWIGLENTCKESALRLASRSHRFGKPIQQVISERRLSRGDATNEAVAAWAREFDRAATVVQPDMKDGEAIVFDGRLWHGSHNTGRGRRSALLLQYASAGTTIAFPDLDKIDEWPFRYSAEEPSSILVSGKGTERSAAPRPAAFSEEPLPIETHLRGGEGFLESRQGWKSYPLFKGSTPILAGMKAHVSVLSPGHCPHPPHRHVEEELLVVLDGEAEILIANSPDPTDAAVKRFGPGSFVYYPAYQHHTIRNVSAAPVTYLMLKWQAAPLEVQEPLGTTLSGIGGRVAEVQAAPKIMRVLFEGPTAFLGKLHAHVTELMPGGGYRPHADKYDVAIIVFSGTVETLGSTLGAGGSVYYAAGQRHGMRNVGKDAAKYLVFEFHGANGGRKAARRQAVDGPRRGLERQGLVTILPAK
jgi:mannose-6-phosphate isomerase-like protein (cupin superfamily)